jgi:trimeric autotransporter adhesin
MRRRLLAFIAGVVLLPAVAAGSAAADDPSVQGAGQSAGSQQSANSSATSTQSSPSNTNISVRIGSPGDGGVVTQTNGSSATSVAGNANDTTQQAAQGGGAPGVATASQSADNNQSADSTATSTQDHPKNTNIAVRIMSPGDDGSVTQTNDSSAKSAAGNKNTTDQSANQSGGGVQNADQHASNKQDATSDATSEQDHPSNVNIPVRIFSDGNGGSVEQTNSSSAKSAAGNKNDTDQSVEQGSGSKSAPVRDACGGGCGSHDGPSVQNAEQKAYNDQSADSTATSEQDHPSNVNIPVRIYSKGDDGSVTQTNSSEAVSAAGNKNDTDQSVEQSAGGSGHGPVVQNVDQKADNEQDASSEATSHQSGASNENYPVRIGSPGGGGSVDQTNSSFAGSVAGNKNDTEQSATQDAGSEVKKAPIPVRDGCSESCDHSYDGCGEKCDSHGGPVVQNVDQKADNDQKADSSAESTQCCASNTNAPVRIKSYGDDGDVTQSNSSEAVSAAGNKNETDQTAEQSAGSGGGDPVQEISQKADSDQDASSDATSHQYGASNENTPVRIKSGGYGGDVEQSNDSAAYSAAGNKNDTDQNATQDAGSAPVKESTCKDGCGHADGGIVVQDIGQKAENDQTAESSADSTQKGASNTNAPVRIKSDGDSGDVSQSNSSTAKSAAGNENETDQSADQSAGGWGAIAVQAIGQKAENDQDADSDATSEQYDPSNTNAPVRIKSDGYDGGVEQSNDSAAYSAAGNENDTTQHASQDAGGQYAPMAGARDGGCGSCGGDGVTVQGIGQWASSEQSADSSADSKQSGACNTNAPVRIKSRGDDGDVEQSNSSTAKSAAGNENDTDQSADQSAGSGGIAVQALGQKADNGQDAESDATSEQYDPSNSNTPVRIKSWGGGGSLYQSNESEALSAAGNKNRTCQRAYQGSGGDPKCDRRKREPVHAMKEV